MGSKDFSAFELLIIQSKNEIGSAVLLTLCWIAVCDGTVSTSEVTKLREIAEASKYQGNSNVMLKIAQSRDLKAIQLAAEILKRNFYGPKAETFLTLAISMAIADRYLKPEENHILRFLADLLGIALDHFDDLFEDVTGRALPNPSDPSSSAYWQARERASQNSQSHSRSDSSSKSSQSSGSSNNTTLNQEAINAYAVLGLEIGASQEEIRNTYRRLAQIHHPDRYSSLGQESVAAATLTFKRIKAAYDYLVLHA